MKTQNKVGIYIAVLVFIFIGVGVVSAEVDSVTVESVFKQNTAIDIKEPCIINGTWCSGSAVCNITIWKPDDSILLSNALMTNQLSFHNKTLTPAQSISLGTYTATASCSDQGLSGYRTFYYQVTPSGSNGILGLSIILILVVYGIALFGFFGKNEWVAIIGGLGLIPLGLYTMTHGIDIYRNFMTDALSVITIGFGAFVALTAGVSIIQENM